jgi:acyl dehydratase
VAATIVGQTTVTAVVDKGADKGALIYQRRTVTDRDSGHLLATVEPTNFCRGDGGLERSDEPPPPPPRPPGREPDTVCDLPTLPQAALIYRLSGDPNPLHAVPQVAAEAGFERPILHGLATFGVVTHALLRTYGHYDPGSVRRVAGRFTAPLYPGETVRTEMWLEGEEVHFRARSLDRDVVVLSNGLASVRP